MCSPTLLLLFCLHPSSFFFIKFVGLLDFAFSVHDTYTTLVFVQFMFDRRMNADFCNLIRFFSLSLSCFLLFFFFCRIFDFNRIFGQSVLLSDNNSIHTHTHTHYIYLSFHTSFCFNNFD